jgi:hypothetical protein
MKTGVMTILFFTVSFLTLFSSANAATFPHAMDGRAREIRFDRGQRLGGERFGREHAGRESFGREHELRAHDLREHEGRAGEGRELHSVSAVRPLPYYTQAVGIKR